MPSLLAGDLDMVLGRLPEEGRSSELVYEEFYAEPVCLVTRRGHPLTRKRRLGLRDLVHEPWLMPLPETTLRRQIERAFVEAGAAVPKNVIESVSILTNRVLLRKSDCIGVMPYHVALDDVEHGLLAILPVKLKSIEGPVGAILRAPGGAAAGRRAPFLSACGWRRRTCRAPSCEARAPSGGAQPGHAGRVSLSGRRLGAGWRLRNRRRSTRMANQQNTRHERDREHRGGECQQRHPERAAELAGGDDVIAEAPR